MNKSVVSVIGLDCPGVIYTIASALTELTCNIENLSQTILKNQFAAIFIVIKPTDLDDTTINKHLSKAIMDNNMQLYVMTYPFHEKNTLTTIHTETTESFIVTIEGKNLIELIVAVSNTLTEYMINIEQIAVTTPPCSTQNFFVMCEIALPLSLNKDELTKKLKLQAKIHGFNIQIQHRNIFEAMHRITPI